MITNTFLETFEIDQSIFGDPELDLDNFQDNVDEFMYDFNLALAKNEVDRWHAKYKDVIEKILPDFEMIEESLLGTQYPTIRWIFKHVPSNTFYKIEGDAESWNDDRAFGESFDPLTRVYPINKLVTVYETEPKLDSWS